MWALTLTAGYALGGLEGIALAAIILALLAIPIRKSKRYVIRLVA